LASVKKLLKRAAQAEEAAEMITATEEQLGQCKHDRKKSTARHKKITELIARDKAELAFTDSEELKKCREVVENWDTYSGLDKEVAQLEVASTALKHEYVTLVEPIMDSQQYVKAADTKQMVRLKTELEYQQKQDELLLHDTALDAADENGEQLCPHCHQQVTAEHIAQVQAVYSNRVAQLKAVKADLAYSQQYDHDLEEYHSRSSCLVDAMTKLEEKLKEVTERLERCPNEAAYDDALTFVRKFKELEERLAEGEEVVRTLNIRISKYDGRVETLHQQRESLAAQVRERPTDEAVVKASKHIEQHEDAVVSHKVAVQCFNESKQNRTRLKQTLDQLKLRLSAKAKIRNLLGTISEAGEIFHWNNLPKIVSQANLELLVDDINDNLQLFNNPFYVAADQDLTFKVYFPGKSPVKAKQLSGGQKVILAIAFRSALDRVFGHDVGMMFLDEPTAGLDADNVEFFHDALQQLAKKVHGSRQLVVITHVQELGGVFDQLIEI
jgi:DNA repair exonuclease SbcCD ATPase subunit